MGGPTKANDFHVKKPRWRTLLAIALTLVAAACSGAGDIYLMNADGTGVRRLTHDSADDVDPAWSPLKLAR
jgi:hypothetical protein